MMSLPASLGCDILACQLFIVLMNHHKTLIKKGSAMLSKLNSLSLKHKIFAGIGLIVVGTTLFSLFIIRNMNLKMAYPKYMSMMERPRRVSE